MDAFRFSGFPDIWASIVITFLTEWSMAALQASTAANRVYLPCALFPAHRGGHQGDGFAQRESIVFHNSPVLFLILRLSGWQTSFIKRA